MAPPKIVDDLKELAEAHDWEVVDTTDGVQNLGFVTEAIQRTYMREVDEDFIWGFGVTWGRRPETGRWNVILDDDDRSVHGFLWYREKLVDRWSWHSISDLKYWLTHPDDLFEEGIVMPTKQDALLQSVLRQAFP